MIDPKDIKVGDKIWCEFEVTIANQKRSFLGPFVNIFNKNDGKPSLTLIPYQNIVGHQKADPMKGVTKCGSVVELRRDGLWVKAKWVKTGSEQGWMVEPFMLGSHLYQDKFFDGWR